ncbi:MAG: AAA family ATPase [Gammaproteobacteria bacterium]|nr:MAG: AAA family ATPase [Gammaproteobacteria bacterium]RKZ43979.1 MAG: AAA family ATPase [Gammaproteobacteria bacterium]RKZ75791.1 MAG: AAA family ATPase [Gammaproteobacteria bacterium]
MEKRKFPYGISDFNLLIRGNYFYVDRTHHIRFIEEAGNQILFLRPRRFGKSLLLSMLENYYDVAKASEFEQLFGDLAIGKNPTLIHNQYFVMKWDFSNVSPEGDADDIGQTLYKYVNNCIKEFALYYQDKLSIKIEIEPNNAISSFQSLLTAVFLSQHKLYLLIDEYDNFANEVMMGNHELSKSRYDALLSGEGVLRVLFKAIKSATSGRGLERVFITGVSPVAMTDITSAYNVAENIYLKLEFNDLCGFKESELTTVINQIAKECDLSSAKAQQALTLMKTYYDGYCFNYRKVEEIYNPTLALYFLKSFQKECQFPRQMLDHNLAMDRNKISYIANLLNGKSLISQALDENPPLSILDLSDRFSVKDVLFASKDTTFIVSLLYYLGILTLNGETEYGELRFKIPNLVIRKLYVEQLFEMYLPDESERFRARQMARNFFHTADLQEICDFMEQKYFKVFDNIDYKKTNELTIKTAFLTVLFDDVSYIMDSETAIKRRYADLTMILRPERRKFPIYDFIIEFKFIKLAELNLSGEKARKLTKNELNALPLVKKKLADAKKQLLDYKTGLQKKYDDELKLKLISVVAVGFERVVWEVIAPNT